MHGLTASGLSAYTYGVDIESEYRKRVSQLSPAERVARMEAMYRWAREQIANRLRAERGPMNARELALRVSLEVYQREPVAGLIRERLARHERCPADS